MPEIHTLTMNSSDSQLLSQSLGGDESCTLV
jgi:hypothetical protein